MLCRGIARRGLQQARQHRCLAEGQLFRLAIEIMQAGRSQAVHIVAEIGVRQIALENLVLRQPGFQPEGDQGLARLAGQRAFRRQECEFGELLRDRAAPARPGKDGPPDTAWIDPPVVVEAAVLDREESLDHVWRQRIDIHRLVGNRAIARDRCPVGSQQGDLRRGDRFERLGQRRGDRQPGDQHEEQREKGRNDPNRPPELAAILPMRALPPALRTPLLRRDGIVHAVQPVVPVVVIEGIVRGVVAPVTQGFRLGLRTAPEGIENAHRLLC